MDQERLVAIDDLPASYYLTDELGVRAAEFIDATPDDAPFFGYLAFTAPHWPLHAPETDIAAQRGCYGMGWDEIRRRRLGRLVALGILPEGTGLSPRDDLSRPWVDVPHQAWEAERMAVYAAQVAAMDRAIGTVLDRIQARRSLDNTLILFLSDNGGCAEYMREDGGGMGERYAQRCKDGTMTRTGNDPRRMPGPADTFMSYDLPWANASNAPFRKFKCWTHEGGISTPLIACWPGGGLPPGAVRHEAGHVVDLAATLCSVAGAERSRLEGVDLVPTWRDGLAPSRPGPLCWEHEGHAAVREGRWKLVRERTGSPWELYDMAVDRIEMDDHAASRPDLVERLASHWEAWAARCGVLPWPLAT